MSQAPAQELDVWLYGTHLATLTRTRDDRLALEWTSAALERWGIGSRLLSAKLTIGERAVPALVHNYIDGLLPEGNARTNHAMTAGVPPDDTFALIRAYGRDTLGAAIFVSADEGDPTRAGSYELLSDSEVARRLLEADRHSPATDGTTVDSSTLPGMIPKITLHREKGKWFACRNGAASTWLIKRAQALGSDVADVVDTEVACLALARELDLTNIQAEIFAHGKARGIAVSRYDRTTALERIHQEDLAQATGLNTADPNKKFQWGSKMPSLRHAADVLVLDGGNPDELLRLVTFSHAVGNTDMHAKNISFLRYDDGRVKLSPAYDIAMHLHHSRDNRRSALDVNGKTEMAAINWSDLVAEGRSWGLTERRARGVVDRTLAELHQALTNIDRSTFPGVSEKAWDVVQQRTSTFLGQAGIQTELVGRVTVTAEGEVIRVPEGGKVAAKRGPRRPR